MVKYGHFKCRIYPSNINKLPLSSLVLRVVNQLKFMGECVLCTVIKRLYLDMLIRCAQYCRTATAPTCPALSRSCCILYTGRCWTIPNTSSPVTMWFPCMWPLKKALRAVYLCQMRISSLWLCSGSSSSSPQSSLWSRSTSWCISRMPASTPILITSTLSCRTISKEVSSE